MHSANLKVRYTENEMLFLSKIKKSKKKSSKKKTSNLITKNLPEILTVCVLNTLIPNSAMLLIEAMVVEKHQLLNLLEECSRE